MLSIQQIQSFFPEQLRPFERNLLREYLQYKMLEAAFATEQGRLLAFLGGTAIHVVHGNARFSEDLDFDNRGVTSESFGKLAALVKRSLEREGFEIELEMRERAALRAHFRFIGLLRSMGITGHREEKLLIHFDTEPQHFAYQPEQVILNKFGVFCRINVVPADILLAQKIACILQRPRPVGRDFYDAMFLWGKSAPNAEYLAQKCEIYNNAHLWEKIERRCRDIDFAVLSKDMEPFVSNAAEAQKVALFKEFVASKQ